MNEKIMAALKNVELENECKILFACESGSRAWGFASSDSDYDVRFIYVNKLSWYLQLEEKSETIDKILPDNLDLCGWDLRKSLKLFAKCNLSLNEWFGSPIIYYQNQKFLNLLTPLVPTYFNSKKGIHHYISTAENIMQKNFQDRLVNIKKLFYIIRAILACRWILQKQSMPPTQFSELFMECDLPQNIMKIIQLLLVEKKNTHEKHIIEMDTTLLSWTEEQIITIKQAARNVTVPKSIDWEPLNFIMIEMI